MRVLLILLLLSGCAGKVPDKTIIPTERIEVPDKLRVPCKAEKVEEKALSEPEVVIYISSLFDEIDDCDNKRRISVEMLDNLNK